MAAPRLPREAHAVAAQVAVRAAHGGGRVGVPIASKQRVFPGDIVIVNGEPGRLVVTQMLTLTLSSAQVIPSRSSSSHAMWFKP